MEVYYTKNYPIRWIKCQVTVNDRLLRTNNKDRFQELGKTKTLTSTFIRDAARIWNSAPDVIKNCKSIRTVKREIKKFRVTLLV